MPVISTLRDAPRVPFKLNGRILYSSAGIEVIHLTLKPGEKMESHIQPFDVIFFVLEGSGVLETGSGPIHGEENTCIWMEAGEQRCWLNTGQKELKVIVIKDIG